MNMLILVGMMLVGLVVYLMYKKPGASFSSTEAKVVAALLDEEAKAKEAFMKGKEDVIAEYERLKTRVASLSLIKAKLPPVAVSVVAPQPVAVPVVVEVAHQPVVDSQGNVIVNGVTYSPVVQDNPTQTSQEGTPA